MSTQTDYNAQEWKAIVYLTGVLKMEEIHGSVISDIVDSILYLSQETTSFKKVRKVENTNGVKPRP